MAQHGPLSLAHWRGRTRRWWLPRVLAATATAVVVPLAVVAIPSAQAEPGSPVDPKMARTAELSETTRLADRRAVVLGDRFYSMGAADTSYPAMGFHTRGEMAGFWAQPIKLLDGVWFAVDGKWLGKASKTTSGYGYVRTDLPAQAGVQVSRTDFVPDGMRAGLIGLTMRATSNKKFTLAMDAHSELMGVYPWGETAPSQLAFNLADTGAVDHNALLFREVGTPAVPNAAPHDWAAVVGSDAEPSASQLGKDHRGPQDPAVICPASGPDAPPQPKRCDDTEYGKGTGGQLSYSVELKAGKTSTMWFAVAGSDQGAGKAKAEHRRALADPEGLLARKVAARKQTAANSVVDLPGDRLLQRSVEWSKQNLADSVQESHDLAIRHVAAGKQYPAPVGTVDKARWLGAGFPDYPWLFGTDGEYTAFAAVAAGQFEPIKAHLTALRDVSDLLNERSGKVVHEVTHDGSVYFGANADEGNTDETSKYPSAVALVYRWTGDTKFRDDLYDFTVRNMHYVTEQLDADGDGWPEGLGNVERPGMGPEKLDNTVYTIRGLRDLADLADGKGDTATRDWATGKAKTMEQAFEKTWWFDKTADQYGDSLTDPANAPVFQRHWIGLTPTDALLVRPGQPTRPLASDEHAKKVLDRREENCYSGEFGLYHTGTGPTSAEGGNKGPECDQEVSTVQSERSIFSLNTAIMAASEGNYGRMAKAQQQRYTTANARIQLDPKVWEMPGAMPEIAPSEDFGQNIDRLFTERSMVLQAWGTYGVLWPVIAQQLGVYPDLGRDSVEVVPQIPDGQNRVAGQRIRLGDGSVDVTATRSGKKLSTVVRRDLRVGLTIGAVLPRGAQVGKVEVNGKPADYTVRNTARGTEVVVKVRGGGQTQLEVTQR
jgi:hypothetical protein